MEKKINNICRVSWSGHSANLMAVSCRLWVTGLCQVLLYAESRALGKIISAECISMPRVSHTAKILCAECYYMTSAALGKQPLCRVPSPRHSAKLPHTVHSIFAEFQHSAKVQHSAYNTFAEFHGAGTRQNLRTWPPRAPAVKPADGRYCLPSAGCQALGKIRIFTEYFFKALGKVCFAECISLALGKYLNFFHCRPQNFLYPIHTTCGTPCSNLVYFWMYFIYFMN